MLALFTFLLLLSIVALIIGLIKPNLVLKWGRTRTRSRALLTYGISAILFFILIGVTAPKQTQKQTAPITPPTPEQPKQQQQNNTSNQPSTNQPATNPPATNQLTIGPNDPKIKPEITVVAKNGGLGDSLTQIEKVYGKPNAINQEMKDGIGSYRFQDDLYIVMFMEGRAFNITVQLDTKKKQMPFKDAEVFVKSFLPSDATFVKTYDLNDTERVYVYQSATIASLLSPQWFQDADGNPQPGQCSIDFVHDGETVQSFTVVTGSSK